MAYGTCSVTTAFGDRIICPNRLYERDYAVLRSVAEDAFGEELRFVLFDDYTHDLSASVGHGKQRTLVDNRRIRVGLDEFAQRFISGPNLPSGEDLDEAVKRVLGCV